MVTPNYMVVVMVTHLKLVCIIVDIPNEQSQCVFEVFGSDQLHVDIHSFGCNRVTAEQQRRILRFLDIWRNVMLFEDWSLVTCIGHVTMFVIVNCTWSDTL